MLPPPVIELLVFVLSPAVIVSAADCTLTQFSQVQDVVANCTDIVVQDLTVPGGESLELDLQTGTTLTFQGQVVFNVSNWMGPLVRITGDQLTVGGVAGHVFDGQGQLYWDGAGSSSASAKPNFLTITDAQNSTFSGINLLNCPISCVSVVSCNEVVLDDFTVDVSEAGEDVNIVGFNMTNCVNVIIKNSVFKNQGDCVVVNEGANNTFQDLVCEADDSLSFSVGFANISISENTEADVTVEDSVILNSVNGIQVKTSQNDGHGSTTNISYSNITVQGINNFGISMARNNMGQGEESIHNTLIRNPSMKSVVARMAGTSSIMDSQIICEKAGCTVTWNWGDGGD
ncbi:polygalacturonase-like [Cylas formicarius]|uniref:polygalacturonase-like n=1 Tax=Cylas formicarius TaxID=197179 RepID=UPI00295889C9|nr:polygalacturonase-like [Cylas formicarius]